MSTHWLGDDVERIDTTLDQIDPLLPVFVRSGLGKNRFLDLITRDEAGESLPVATVSKRYTLVQHAEAAKAVTNEIQKQGIDPAGVPVHLLLSEYGSRIALRATLPDAYSVTPPDGHKMALTFECFNSVDRSVPLMAAVGWFRFVCSNGLIVGTASAKVRQRHSPPLNIGEISEVLAEGLAAAVEERKAFAKWSGTRVAHRTLVSWVDGPVADAWGPYAAARVYGIATTGEDGAPERVFRKVAPHERSLIETSPVPGAKNSCDDAYGIAQVLAWVAAQRNNVAERLEWRAEIPALMQKLAA
jgi:hypothetical protein